MWLSIEGSHDNEILPVFGAEKTMNTMSWLYLFNGSTNSKARNYYGNAGILPWTESFTRMCVRNCSTNVFNYGLPVAKPPRKNPNPNIESQWGQEYMISFFINPFTSL
jgi:hypothetical protein